MKTFKITNDGELDLSSGELTYDYDIDAIKTLHKIRLQTFKGECYYDESLGVQYIGSILGSKAARYVDIKEIFISELSKIPGTLTISEIYVDVDSDRKCTVNYTCICDSGTFSNEVVV